MGNQRSVLLKMLLPSPLLGTIKTSKNELLEKLNKTNELFGINTKVYFDMKKLNPSKCIPKIDKDKAIKALKNIDFKSPFKGGSGGGPSRPMKYPYTFTAKIAQFPYKFYFKNNWVFRYYLIALIVSFPIFWKISKLANSPANKAKWKEIRRKEKEAQKHHHDHH